MITESMKPPTGPGEPHESRIYVGAAGGNYFGAIEFDDDVIEMLFHPGTAAIWSALGYNGLLWLDEDGYNLAVSRYHEHERRLRASRSVIWWRLQTRSGGDQ